MPNDRSSSSRSHYVWRKLSAAKWEDVWFDRLSEVSDRLAVTALAGAKTIRLEAFQLTRAQAERLRRAFGGQVVLQKGMRATVPSKRPPIVIRDKLVVVATAEEMRGAPTRFPGRKVMHIPAGMAFGTGDHATTATCLRLLVDVIGETRGSWQMLDLGTGSGILAIAGRLLGAGGVVAGDFDPHAVRTAKENVRANAIGGVKVLRLDVREWWPDRTWDVVAANLFSGLLIEAAPKIAAATKKGGRLIFSGILRAQEDGVLRAFKAQRFRIDRIVRKGKWIAGLATRRA